MGNNEPLGPALTMTALKPAEKIERLANLNPADGQLNGRAVEMFGLLRAYAMLDWVLRHPNDQGVKRLTEKFSTLIERTWALMDGVQGEVEAGQSIVTTNGG